MGDLHCQNQSIQDNFLHIQHFQQDTYPTDDIGDTRSRELQIAFILQVRWYSDSYEHVTSIITQTTIIWAPDSLKCKLLLNTFRDTTLKWYIGLPRFSINSYQNLVKKVVHHIVARKHRKMVATNLFNIRQSLPKYLREYFALFNEVTIKVIHPNQEMFIGAFQNGLVEGRCSP